MIAELTGVVRAIRGNAGCTADAEATDAFEKTAGRQRGTQGGGGTRGPAVQLAGTGVRRGRSDLRPGPLILPISDIFLTAAWRHLLLLNYEMDPALLQPLLPRGTTLDTHDDRTWVSLVGFRFLDTRVLGVPVPFHRDFDEVNLRFYVRRETAGEIRRGVVFMRELVPRAAIALLARAVYN